MLMHLAVRKYQAIKSGMNEFEKHGIGCVVPCCYPSHSTKCKLGVIHCPKRGGGGGGKNPDKKRLFKLFQELGRESALACPDDSAGDPVVVSLGRQSHLIRVSTWPSRCLHCHVP
jgi:hypothetical protein